MGAQPHAMLTFSIFKQRDTNIQSVYFCFMFIKSLKLRKKIILYLISVTTYFSLFTTKFCFPPPPHWDGEPYQFADRAKPFAHPFQIYLLNL